MLAPVAIEMGQLKASDIRLRGYAPTKWSAEPRTARTRATRKRLTTKIEMEPNKAQLRGRVGDLQDEPAQDQKLHCLDNCLSGAAKPVASIIGVAQCSEHLQLCANNHQPGKQI